MPPTLTYPGVYIQEIPSGVRTITGVATSITAFFGRASRGPLNKAVRCQNYSDFLRSFGGPHAASELAASVRQFFDNGGTDSYVVRLAHNAQPARVSLENYAGLIVLHATAKQEGAWGNGLRLEVDYNTPDPGESFNLRVILEEGGRVTANESFANLSMDIMSNRFAPTFVTQGSQLIDLRLATETGNLGDPTTLGSNYNIIALNGYSQGCRSLGGDGAAVQATLNGLIHPAAVTAQHSFEIAVNGSASRTVNLSSWVVPATLSSIEADLKSFIDGALQSLVPPPTVTVTFQNGGPVGQLLRITSASGALSSVKVRRAAANDLSAALMLGTDQGGVEMVRRSNLRPAPTGSVLRVDENAPPGNLNHLTVIAALLQTDLTGITIDGVLVPLNVAPNNIHTVAAAGSLWFQDALPGSSPNNNSDGVREKLRIIANAISNNPSISYRAEVHGYQLVILPTVGTINQQPVITFEGAVAATDALTNALTLNVRQYKLGLGGTSAFVSNAVDGTDDDGNPPDFADYTGDPAAHTGFNALDMVDLFNLMVLPRDSAIVVNVRESLWGPASIYCRAHRAFLLIDAPDGWTSSAGLPAIVQNSSQVNDLRATVVKDHAAVFYPRLRFRDAAGVHSIGPTGAIAGLMSRIDASRGVWKAPAGTEADLRGLAGVEVKLTDMENGVLNKLGANCIRSFPSGFAVWGARTMDGSDDIGSEWKYIPIRRLALMIEESLYRGTQWVVFEPNDEPLWAKIRLNVGVFMNNLFRQGAFQGSTPRDAYFVKCDTETTTQADRDLGIVNIQVGFAPLKPAEFVVITIQQIAGQLAA